MSATTGVPWSAGSWSTPPAAVAEDGPDLLVTAVEGSDAWRHTAYGFVHDDAHALLAPLADPGAVEVAVDLDYGQQFDQAGLLLRVDAGTWLKAGVEVSDGVHQVGAVVTLGRSDWSVAPVPGWAGRRVTVRARVDDEPFRLVRVAPFPAGVPVSAGPYCCAPTRAGLTVRFRRWTTGPADAALH